mmetsp:Transcript_1651/g.10148  ORF Transcript_1651/g.10148 Transcript_1651/m.10148 type:complete len:326 (-) Transcript_1651:1631-2608(-)|eukprot:CAMPEP_0183829238 /NCGR_PEP_ID=MMETSP0807_2-20130328/3201_1 /TAXON_ID=88271 /ORGANISM="Picocystis salinarum, Strain CCMP1897" /LENGTH=325 /DNA_ID=CAMNT_0026074445 /DNA_START=227 /DNA_END=1204 /DNA_ORIENTATION=+
MDFHRMLAVLFLCTGFVGANLDWHPLDHKDRTHRLSVLSAKDADRFAKSQMHWRSASHPGDKSPRRVALCFFGLTRSLRYVYFSILLHIVQPLMDQNITVDRYMHTYNLSQISNKRSKEKSALDLEEYRLLEPFQGLLVTDQSDFLNAFNLSSMLVDNYDTYRDDFQSMKNLACQLHSLQLVTKLWQHSGWKYDLVIYSRPDVLYVRPVVFSAILRKLYHRNPEKTWVLPQFGNIRGRMNDRFAMGLPGPMSIWGTRMEYVGEFVSSLKLSIHAERLVKFVAEREKIRILKENVQLVRVRANGKSNAFWDRKQMDRWSVPVLKMS